MAKGPAFDNGPVLTIASPQRPLFQPFAAWPWVQFWTWAYFCARQKSRKRGPQTAATNFSAVPSSDSKALPSRNWSYNFSLYDFGGYGVEKTAAYISTMPIFQYDGLKPFWLPHRRLHGPSEGQEEPRPVRANFVSFFPETGLRRSMSRGNPCRRAPGPPKQQASMRKGRQAIPSSLLSYNRQEEWRWYHQQAPRVGTFDAQQAPDSAAPPTWRVATHPKPSGWWKGPHHRCAEVG